ncbi:hypothetical protein [Micromonospora craniellae]|uniref:hypothetical protein n=1 Tax=Micromonospora craniellae TaxID=2294034 RepID=UPI00168B5B68|nr:hypothetical protein [Micromonospora craniellae]QOC94039.1 hypothetical protein ID554_10735 [Micromonospora craniellae]
MQQAALRYEHQVALYVDVLAECRHRQRWLHNLTREHRAVRGKLKSKRLTLMHRDA